METVASDNKVEVKCVCGTVFPSYYAKVSDKSSPDYGKLKLDKDKNKMFSQTRCPRCRFVNLAQKRTIKIIATAQLLGNLGNAGYDVKPEDVDEIEEEINMALAEAFNKLRRTSGKEEKTVFSLSAK